MGILYAKALKWFGLYAAPEQRKCAKSLSKAQRLSYIFNCYLSENKV